MSNIIIINGSEKLSHEPTINAYDRGLTLGHGLFETIMINKGIVSALEYHWERLVASAKIIDIKIPFSFNQMQEMIKTLLEKNNFQAKICCLRITITDGISERGLLPMHKSPATYIFSLSELSTSPVSSIKAIISSIKKNENSISHMVKSISYIDNIIAKKEAMSRGADEAFMLNSRGYIAEGTISNIFILKGNTIYTPPIHDGVLPGITRHIILNDLKLENYTIMEKSIDLDFLMLADEVFISNSLMGVVSVCSIDNIQFNCKSNIIKIINNLLKKNYHYQ